jgi:hypothetical protein
MMITICAWSNLVGDFLLCERTSLGREVEDKAVIETVEHEISY